MAQYLIQVPAAYSSRVGGNGLQSITITVEADSPHAAVTQAVQYGIPAAAIPPPAPVVGDVTSGSLPPTPGGTLDPANNPVYRSSLGSSNPLPSTAGGSSAAGLNYRATQPYYGVEESSGNNFAPNVGIQPNQYNPDSTTSIERVNAAMGNYVPGTPGDPFYQPPSYKRMTPADFAAIRNNAASSLPEVKKDEGPAAFSANDLTRIVGDQTQDGFSSDNNRGNPARMTTGYIAPADITTRSFSDTLSAVKSGGISLYSGGTFDLTPFENPEFWDATFQDLGGNFTGNQEGDARAAMLRAMAKQIAAASGGNAFEAKKAVKEFYKQAESQMNSRGFGDLNLSDGGTLNTFAFAQQKTEKVEEVASTDQKKADATASKYETTFPSLGTGGGEIGGEGEGFFPIEKSEMGDNTADLLARGTSNYVRPEEDRLAAIGQPGMGVPSGNGLISIQDIIDTFEQANAMPATTQIPQRDINGDIVYEQVDNPGVPFLLEDGTQAKNPDGSLAWRTPPSQMGSPVMETIVNPLLIELLDAAQENNGYVTDQNIADAKARSAVDVAQLQSDAAVGVAEANGASAEAVAELQRQGDEAVAKAQAGSASAFGFLNQGGTQDQLSALYESQANPLGFTGEQNFGLEQGRVSNNQFGFLQQNSGASGLAARNSLDQVLRGGLSAKQRIAEINAGQSGQNQANFLNFIGNPSAVGFATESGLFSPGQGLNAGLGSNVLQDISNAEAGNIPGSLFGFNSPSSAGAGGNQTTNTGNFNANTLRNASDEQIGFLQGAASAGGQTPSEFKDQVESFTPAGVSGTRY
jgi:hypothetical protein